MAENNSTESDIDLFKVLVLVLILAGIGYVLYKAYKFAKGATGAVTGTFSDLGNAGAQFLHDVFSGNFFTTTPSSALDVAGLNEQMYLDNAYSPNLLSANVASQYAANLHDAVLNPQGNTNPTFLQNLESFITQTSPLGGDGTATNTFTISSVLGQLQYQVQVSQIAFYFNLKYGVDLQTFFNNNNVGGYVLSYVNSLPTGIVTNANSATYNAPLMPTPDTTTQQAKINALESSDFGTLFGNL